MSHLLPLDDDPASLNALVAAVLDYWRAPETTPVMLDGMLSYYLAWRRERRIKPDTLQLRRLTSLNILDRAVEEIRPIDPLLEALLVSYYNDRLSDGMILNRHQAQWPARLTSRPIVNRLRNDAIALLTQVLAAQEREARAQHVAELLGKLPDDAGGDLFGRAADAARLTGLLLAADLPLVYLSGMGGIGKTALATAVITPLLQRLHFLHLFWFNVSAAIGQVSHTLTDGFWPLLVGRLVKAFGLTDLDRADLAQQEAELRRVLAAVPHLIVIDDLDAPILIDAIAERLAAIAGRSKCLLIGRVEPAAARVSALHTLAEIDDDATTALLHHRAGQLAIDNLRHASPAQLARVPQTIGGHPQALTLLLELARRRELDDLLHAFRAVDMSRIETLYNDIYAALWALVAQQQSALALLDALTLVTAHGAHADYLRALADLDTPSFWDALDELASLSFLITDRRAVPLRYLIHQLTRTYLHHQHAGGAPAGRAARLTAGCGYWKARTQGDDALSAATLAQHYDNISQLLHVALDTPETWPAAVDCCGALFLTVENSPFWREFGTLCAFGLSRAPAAGGTRERLRLMRILGWLYRVDNRYAEAIEMLEQAIALAQTTGQIDLMGECYVYLSIAQRHLHRFELATAAADDALDIFEELRETHRAWLGAATVTKGLSLFHAGDFAAALPHYTAAIAHYTAAGHKPGVVRARNNLGNAHKELAQLPQALAELSTAYTLAIETGGSVDRDLVATSLLDLALYAIDVPLLAEVRQYAHARALAPDTTSYHRALLLMGLGQLARRETCLDAAAELLEQACALWRDQPERPLRAVALAEWGLTLHALGDRAQATACLAESRAVAGDDIATNRLYTTAAQLIAQLAAALQT